MCGIFGEYLPGGADPAHVERMARRLAHRGPDGDGFTVSPRGMCAIGAGRLAIIDLPAPAGPLFNEDRSVAVTFNGEIYNHRQLRAELEGAGHHFSTHTDTETIVHGYEQWGDAVFAHLRGMFAIALLDMRGARDRLVLARDRAGEKPLYLAQVGSGWIFASEVKALLEPPGLRAAHDPDRLLEWLILGYVPSPHTFFAGIDKLQPAELVVIEGERAARSFYWTPDLDPPPDQPFAQSVREVRAMLETVIDAQRMSDVPIGAFLSGGVDSSAIAAIMARQSSQPVQTFTVGFDFPAGSEADRKFNVDARAAAAVAAHIGAQHHAITLDGAALPDLLPHLIYHLDEPILQTTIVQSAYVPALARSLGVPVLLNGEGADELFLGYDHYRADAQLARYLAIPAIVRETALTPMLERLPGARADRLRKLAHKSRQTDGVARYLEWSRVIDSAVARRLLTAPGDDGGIARALRPLIDADPARSFAERIAFANARSHVADCLNLRVDKMSMAMSIEARAPFEDDEFARLAYALPLDHKLGGGQSKRVLKAAIADLVPPEVLTRPKWGFNPPASDWLRGALRPLVESVLTRDRVEAAGVFRYEAVAGLIDAHIGRREYHLFPLWAALTFHLWHGVFVAGDLKPEGALTPRDLYPMNGL